MSVLSVEGVVKRYENEPTPALGPVSFDVRDGDVLAVVGSSGAGKTTLLRLLCGLTAPTAGTVLHRGRPVDGPPRELALVFQDYGRSLFPWLNVRRNVSFALRGVPRAEAHRRAREALEQVGLGDVESRYPWQLSGGMQQRVALARGLVARPDVLLLDEPFGSVDAMTREGLQDLLLRLHERVGLTIVHVTHDIDEAVYVADRVLALGGRPGRVLATVDVALPRPREQLGTRSAARFLEVRNELHRVVAAPRQE